MAVVEPQLKELSVAQESCCNSAVANCWRQTPNPRMQQAGPGPYFALSHKSASRESLVHGPTAAPIRIEEEIHRHITPHMYVVAEPTPLYRQPNHTVTACTYEGNRQCYNAQYVSQEARVAEHKQGRMTTQ